MFGLFKRTKIAEWEINLLKNIIELLPPDYHFLETQINEGLLKGILLEASDLSGYNAFTYNSQVIKKFENRKAEGYAITGIKVFDKMSQTYLNYSIHISSGVINGYSITGAKKFKIDENNVDVKSFKQTFRVNVDYQKIVPYLSVQEREIVNQNEVYEVVLDGKVLFHIKDLEDGDFIGMDYERNIYNITHDPFEIKPIHADLLSVLK